MMTEEKGAGNMVTREFSVRGMSCTSCENSIEKQALSVEGVQNCKADFAREKVIVSFDSTKTNFDVIKKKIEEKQYECSGACNVPDKQPKKKASIVKPVVLTLALVAILFGGYQFMQGFAAFDLPAIGGPASLILLFGVGLLTGFHCVGMCGGFVMSYTAKNTADGRKGLNISSHAQYGAGKLISYTAIGALFGLIGTIFVFTPMLRGAASMVAGVFLVLFGVSMLGYLPFLRKIRIPMPSSLSKFVYGNEEGSQRRPLVTGLLNGLMIACGPLQALYIYAAGTGSVAQGALALFAFGLGTLPVMFGFGMFTSYVSKSMTQNILKASGIIVIVLGLIMLNRGLALTGTGYDATSIIAVFGAQSVQASAVSGAGAVVSDQGFQEIRMNVTARGWEPDTFVLRAGVPVKWIINGKEITSCNKAIQVPKLGLSFDIKQGEQVIEFTAPSEEGVIPWSCWMGMIQGTFIVKKDVDLSNQTQVQNVVQTAPKASSGGSCGMSSGGGCGCGMM